MRNHLGITVQDALRIEPLTGARVAAGGRGLGRIIRHVNVMEVPDILDWVREGELLLTTAFSIKDDPAAQARLIPALAELGLAGLAIKPKRYLQEIPGFMVQQADEWGFPLLELPPEVSFSEIINPVMGEILGRQTLFMSRLEEVHRQLTDAVLGGYGLSGVAQTLSALLRNPVLIRSGQSAAFQPGPQGETTAEELMAELPEQVPPQLIRAEISWQGRKVTRHTMPVIAAGVSYGSITVWGVYSKIGSFDLIALERASTVAALEIVSERAVREVERRYRNEFLDDLLTRADTTAETLARSGALGWDLSLPRVAVVFEPETNTMSEATYVEAKTVLLEVAGVALRGRRHDILGEKGRLLILLLHSVGTPTPRDLALSIAAEVTGSADRRGLRVRAGIGRYHGGLDGLIKSYQEAVKALTIGRGIAGTDGLVHFDDLGVYRLLHFVGNGEELRDFYRETVGPLAAYDAEKGTDLVGTLEAYFACAGNLKRMSERLFTHYNTILYRVDRIEAICALSLANPNERLNLQLGLKIRSLVQGVS